MSDHQMPRTLEEARTRGYERITDLNSFLVEKLGMTLEEFNKAHRTSAAGGEVNCAQAPRNTPCYSECHEDKHVGIFGVCGPNGTCDLYQGPC